jgi:hypothetical protein
MPVTITKIPSQEVVFEVRSFWGATEWINSNAIIGVRYIVAGNGRQFEFYAPTDEEMRSGCKGSYPNEWDTGEEDDEPTKSVAWG